VVGFGGTNKVTSDNDSLQKRYKEALEILASVPGITNFVASEFLGGIRPANHALHTQVEIESEVKKGIKILNKIVSEGKEPDGIYLILGSAYTRILDLKNSIYFYEMSIKKEPARELAYINLLGVLWDGGDYKKALELIEQYKMRFPSKQYEYHFFKGVTHQRDMDYRKAIDEFMNALQVKPDSAETRVALGTAYLYNQEFERAEQQFNLAIHARPELKAQVEQNKTDWKLFEEKKAGR